MLYDLNFEVNGQSLKWLNNDAHLVKGSRKFLKCVFESSNELKEYRKIARFKARNDEEYMPILDGKCIVPDNISDHRMFHVSVISIKDDQFIPTNEVTIRQEVTS